MVGPTRFNSGLKVVSANPKHARDPKEMAWIEHGRCIGEDPELFFPVGNTGPAAEQTARAIAVCMACPVRTTCLEWALDTCQDAGVWGGLDEEQRRQIRRARRLARDMTAGPGRLVVVN
jgi:WhiB family transcriptional regulator, redox-sensing transcriptional regulator